MLFRIPIPWVGPVWAPVVVSIALVASGLMAARRLRRGVPSRVRPLLAAAAIGGGCLVVASFLVDSGRLLAGDQSARTGWTPFWTGMSLAAVVTAVALAVKPSGDS